MALAGQHAPFWYRPGEFIASGSVPRTDTTALGFLADRFSVGAWELGA